MMRSNTVLDPTRTGREAQDLEENLRRLIVGQDEAIEQIVNIYQMHQTALNPPGRPIGNFLFLGPTGSGKTRVVEATAESLVGTARALIKVDCAEFQHSHEIAKLVGSPPGYLGHRETHPLLSQEMINQYHTERVKVSFILFDEIEKASDALWNLLLGILDKATLTLGDNRKVDFSRAMIFLTSNLGAGEMSSIMSPKLGFANIKPAQTGQALDGKTEGKVARSAMEAARRKFTPEFMNRLDKIVVFKSLGTLELRRILDIELRMVQQRIFHSAGDRSFLFTVTDSAREHLLVEGTDTRYGARHLKRAIERLVVQPISNLIASDQIAPGDWVKVDMDCDNTGLLFLKEAEGMSLHAMAQAADTPLAALAASVASQSGIYEAPRATSTRSGRRN
jgi:ATP-dependent Clp protease ATP-binding subunit ClpB